LSKRYVAQDQFQQFDQGLANRFIKQDQFKQFDQGLANRYVAQDQFKQLDTDFNRYRGETSERLSRIDNVLDIDKSLATRLSAIEKSLQTTDRQLSTSLADINKRIDTLDSGLRTQLDAKADASDMKAVNTRLDKEVRTINTRLDRFNPPIIRGPER
jgi:citrate synthase